MNSTLHALKIKQVAMDISCNLDEKFKDDPAAVATVLSILVAAFVADFKPEYRSLIRDNFSAAIDKVVDSIDKIRKGAYIDEEASDLDAS